MNAAATSVRRIGYATATSGYRDGEQQRRLAILEGLVPVGVEVVPIALPGPEFLDRPEHFDEAIAAATAWVSQVRADEYDVLISAGALDPGLPGLRQIAPVPVIGPGEASLFVGALLDRLLSIVTVDEHAVAKAAGFIEQTTTKPAIVSVRSMDFPVRRIVGDLDGGREALRREARAAVMDDGCEAIMLGAMTLGTLGLDQALRDELGVPVINPLQASIQVAVSAIRSLGLLA